MGNIMIGHSFNSLLLLVSLLMVGWVIWNVTLWINVISFVADWLVKWVLGINWVHLNLVLNHWSKTIDQTHRLNVQIFIQGFMIKLWWSIAVNSWRVGTVSYVCFDLWVSFLVLHLVSLLHLIFIDDLHCALSWVCYRIVRIGLKVKSYTVHHFSGVLVVICLW